MERAVLVTILPGLPSPFLLLLCEIVPSDVALWPYTLR